jgi:hypothetical protein
MEGGKKSCNKIPGVEKSGRNLRQSRAGGKAVKDGEQKISQFYQQVSFRIAKSLVRETGGMRRKQQEQKINTEVI